MKVILYMAITANGIIAKPDDNTDFTSKEDWASFRAVCEKAGAVVIGRRTYEIMAQDPNLFWLKCQYFVLTSNESLESNIPNVTIMAGQSPRNVLQTIAQKGFKEVVVAGGSKNNASFLKDRLADEICLDVEPFIFGQGIPLFAPADFEFQLELLEVKSLSPQTVQLHYRVKK